MRIAMILTVLVAVASTSGIAMAADPPGLMNYQGVLRDDNDNPLDGTYDMIFRFYDDADPVAPENEIFVDEHLAAGTGAVAVTGGLFDVVLGSGNFYDGSGAGDHPHVYYVFGLHETIYLEVQVGAEILEPRMQVVSAPYAIHAAVLGGYTPSDFVNTGSEEQEKTGLLRALGGVDFGGGADDDLTAAEVTVLTSGPASYADFLHQHAWADNADTVDSKHAYEFADAVHGHTGSEITGPVSEAGNADTLDTYDSMYFLNTSSAAQFKEGPLIVNTDGVPGSTALEVVGEDIGGAFSTINGNGSANIAKGQRGIEGFGEEMGGYFKNTDPAASSEVQLATLLAAGSFDGPGGTAYLGTFSPLHSDGYGISATGLTAGGHFKDSQGSGEAEVAVDDIGLFASGDYAAVLANNTQEGGTAVGALGHYRGSDEFYGVWARGDAAGGYFEHSGGGGTAKAYIGGVVDQPSQNYFGVWAEGSGAGGYFERSGDQGNAYIGGFNSSGVSAWGTSAGVLSYNDSGTTSYLAFGSSTTWGNGAKDFVQNHPYEDDKVIVYASLEGDEVGTYTRGRSRLVEGEARVELGETFEWVTNPDIGLTAHVTPRGEAVPLAVVELTPEELVVRGAPDDPPDTAFDYVVYGLRIGFEESGVVREKEIEAYIPSMNEHRELYEKRPELRQYNAFERFKRMHADVLDADLNSLDLSATEELRAAVHEYDPAVDPPVHEHFGRDGKGEESVPGASFSTPDEASVAPGGAAKRSRISDVNADTAGPRGDRTERPLDFEQMFLVGGPVDTGDLLALDPERPGVLVRAAIAQDPAVMGIAASETIDVAGEFHVELVATNYAVLKVDAGYGEIRPGDLLTSSFTPGHAMRAIEMLPGTIVGKALEPLDTGTGSIRVLVMSR